MLVAWLAGALMSWLAESYRRCTFANQQAARLAHTKELEEKSRHLVAQQELATAREEVLFVCIDVCILECCIVLQIYAIKRVETSAGKEYA
jgi:hypothetical protein